VYEVIMEIYMDHAATTYVRKEVKEEMDKYFSEEFGNPGSFNSIGFKAKEALDNARKNVSELLNCIPEEVVFTGSGTESINLAIQGVAKASGKGHIITSAIEHHAVLHTCEALEKEGFKVTYLPVDKQGLVNPKDVEKAIRKDTILISIMYANNEIGTIQPIKEISKITRKRGILFHTDACQAGGALDINVERLGVDLMTLNSSKIYGPKGVGMLFVKRGTPIRPIIHGGGHEFGLRSGTENLPGIIGFAKALELAQKERVKEGERLSKLRDGMIKEVLKIPESFLNGHPTKRLPNNVNITFLNIEGEALLLHLNEKGICAATGSACTSGSLDPSHVILATGLPYEAAHGSIRFTLGLKTTEDDINHTVKALPDVVDNLRKMSPVKLKVKDVR
jgi:cysteine desulfurase